MAFLGRIKSLGGGEFGDPGCVTGNEPRPTWKRLGLPGCAKYPLARRAPVTHVPSVPLSRDSPLFIAANRRTFVPVDKE